MPAFPPPLSLRLNGGLRTEAFRLPLAPIEQLFGVPLTLRDDLELGGVHYGYTAEPLPATGLLSVLIHANDATHPVSTYAHRPDLGVALIVDWFGDNLLDLGRLEWQLRAAYGDLFDVAEYSIATLPADDAPEFCSEVHWAQFAQSHNRRGAPLADTPRLACSLSFDVHERSEARLRAALGELDDTWARIRGVDASPGDGSRIPLTVRLDTQSLLEPGRYAQAMALAIADDLTVRSYAIEGDLQRDGVPLRIEKAFSADEWARHTWMAARPVT